MLDDLERWAAEARARDAAEGRVRERHLRQAAGQDAGFVGVLLDLAEQAGSVIVTTVRGTTFAGRVVAVGDDFAGLRTSAGRVVLIAFPGIADVSPAPGHRGAPAAGFRSTQSLDVTLGDMLASAAAARCRMSIRCGERVVNGELRSVGRDVITLLAAGPPPRPSYVVLKSVSDASFLDSG